MEIILAIALIYGTVKGVEYAATYATKHAATAASKQWQSYKSRPRPTTAPGRVGRAIGRTASTGWHAARHGARGFAAGWRAGWPEGKQRAYDWHERRQTVTTPGGATVTPIHGSQPAPETFPNGPAGRATPIAIPHRTKGSSALAVDPVVGVRPRKAGVPVDLVAYEGLAPTDPDPSLTEHHLAVDEDNLGTFRLRDENHRIICDFTAPSLDEADRIALEQARQRGHDGAGLYARDDEDHETFVYGFDLPDGLATVTPITEGASDMTIATATGGEVTTYGTLIAELQAIQAEAVADLEDAQGDAQRAKEDASRTETMLASLASLKLDTASLNEIGQLGEAASARLRAAEDRQAAAEARAAAAETALKGVQTRHSAIQEHSNVLAERDFYQPA